MNFLPVRSSLQTSVVDPAGPDSYASNISGPLTQQQAELEFQLDALCRFHQILYGELRERDARIAETNDQMNRALEGGKPTDEADSDGCMTVKSRIWSAIDVADQEVVRTKHLADEYTVIGLWASAEQYLGKVFVPLAAHVNGVPEASVKKPYRWEEFTVGYSDLGLDLTTLHDFSDANECRVLNNAIKHAGKVEARLAAFSFFTGRLGAKLSAIEFEMQRYVNGVTHFLGSLIERSSHLIDPSFRR